MKDGKFVSARRDGVCSVCGDEAELQSGTSVCDNCYMDRILRGIEMQVMLWKRDDGRVGWSHSDREGAPIMSFHKGWGRDYEAGHVGNGWHRTTISELNDQEVEYAQGDSYS